MFVGSDALALAPLTRRIAYLHDGDWTVVDRQGARFFDVDGDRGRARGQADPADRRRDRQGQLPPLHGKGAARAPGGDRRHAAPDGQSGDPRGGAARRCRSISPRVPRITISACGSAFYAGLVGRWWFEAMARIPTDGDVASEFRYRTPPLPQGGLGLLVTQSGETADTLAALRYMREQGQQVLSIVNVPESSMARESDAVLETVAGPEIGVASTKAFTAQLVGAGVPGAGGGAGARRDHRGAGGGDDRRAAGGAQPRGGGAGTRRGDPGDRARASRRRATCCILGRGNCYPDRAGRRAEAEGDQLHPRRGLCRRRNEARADRADRSGGAGDRHRCPPGRCSRRPRRTCRKRRRAAAR